MNILVGSLFILLLIFLFYLTQNNKIHRSFLIIGFFIFALLTPYLFNQFVGNQDVN